MLLPVPNNSEQWPTCGVVVEKHDDVEIVCPSPANKMVNVTNPDNPDQVYAVVLVCDKHDQDMTNGKSLILVSEDGVYRFGVNYEGGENDAR